MWKIFFIKSPKYKYKSYPWLCIAQDKCCLNLNKTNRLCWRRTKFYLNQLRNLHENELTSLYFLIQMWPWMKGKVIQTSIKAYTLRVSIIIPSLTEIGLWMSKCKTTPIFFFSYKISHSSFPRILIRQRKRQHELHQTYTSQLHIKFHSNWLVTLRKNWHRSCCFLASLWSWIKVKIS